MSVSTRTAAPPVPLRGLALLFTSVIFLASGWPLAKLAIIHGAAPLWFAQARAIQSAAITTLLLSLSGRMILPTRRDLPALLTVGLLQLAAFFALAHIAVAWVSAGRTAVLANTTTIFVIPLSMLFLHEPISARRWLATLVGLGGIAVLVGPWAVDWTSAHALIGNAFLLGCALCWGVTLLTLRRCPPFHSMFQLLPWCFLLAFIALLPLVLIESPHPVFGAGAGAFAPLLIVGLIAGPLGTWGAMEAAACLPAIVTSVGYLTTPAFGILLSALIVHEPVTPDLVAGTTLILAGVGLAVWPARR